MINKINHTSIIAPLFDLKLLIQKECVQFKGAGYMIFEELLIMCSYSSYILDIANPLAIFLKPRILPKSPEAGNFSPFSLFHAFLVISGEAVQTRDTIGLTTRWRHVGSLSTVVSYYGAGVSRYANSDSTFQLIRVISGDISKNPGRHK